ncbi:hypothetical protein H311_02989 [Anncaliia algerae PRA109]|nr:hypothetical protein H311_02989 [Anncaliia algerae PRA109]
MIFYLTLIFMKYRYSTLILTEENLSTNTKSESNSDNIEEFLDIERNNGISIERTPEELLESRLNKKDNLEEEEVMPKETTGTCFAFFSNLFSFFSGITNNILRK